MRNLFILAFIGLLLTLSGCGVATMVAGATCSQGNYNIVVCPNLLDRLVATPTTTTAPKATSKCKKASAFLLGGPGKPVLTRSEGLCIKERKKLEYRARQAGPGVECVWRKGVIKCARGGELVLAMLLSLLLGLLKPYLRTPLVIAIVFGLLNVAHTEAKGLSCEKAVQLLLEKAVLNPEVAVIYLSKCKKKEEAGTEAQWKSQYEMAKKLLVSMESLKGSSWLYCSKQTGEEIDGCFDSLRRAMKLLDAKVLKLGNKWWDKKEERWSRAKKAKAEKEEKGLRRLLKEGEKITTQTEDLVRSLGEL